MFMTGMLARMVSMVKSPWLRRSSARRSTAIALSGEVQRPLKKMSPSHVQHRQEMARPAAFSLRLRP